MSIEAIIKNLNQYYTFGEATTHQEYTIFPIISPDSTLSILGLVEGEENDLAWIQESEGSESVSHLEAINKSDFPVLIPYLHQVVGGKQDRTIFEPIIIPVGHDERNPLIIPARCIEQNRWGYRSSRGEATSSKFFSSGTRMASQMANISSNGDQSVLWGSVGMYAEAMPTISAEARTSSFREIQELVYEKKEEYTTMFDNLSSALNVPDQIGLVCYFGDKILGLEFYSTNSLWKQFSESVLKGFLSDHIFMKEETATSPPEGNIGNTLIDEFADVKLEEYTSTGAGELYQFAHEKWQGITLQYEKELVHFYATKRQVDIFKGKKTRLRSQGVPRPDLEVQGVRNQADEQIIVEQVQR